MLKEGKISTSTVFWLIYSLFIIYGTLMPFRLNFSLEALPAKLSQMSLIPFVDPDGSRASIPDIVQNIILFLPFGFFAFLTMPAGKAARIALAGLLGFSLSAFVEGLQLFTVDRTTSLTDLFSNTAGTLAGAFFCFMLLDSFDAVMKSSRFRQYRNDKYFYLALIALAAAGFGALQPFAFTLDVGSVYSKIKMLIRNPFYFDPVIRDEGIVFFRFFLLGCSLTFWLKRIRFSAYITAGFLLSAGAGLFFEACQLFVETRMPTAQDAAIIISACFASALFMRCSFKNVSPSLWVAAVVLATLASVAVESLSPFKLAAAYEKFEWIPFISLHYSSSLSVIGRLIETMTAFFPLGFLFWLFSPPGKKSLLLVLATGLVVAVMVEIPQGWIVGRFPGVTDILGGIAGAAVGSIVCSEWESRFERQKAI